MILFVLQHKRWLIPIALLFLAGMLVVLGIGWAVITGVAIPDQDPTPAMQAYARFHDRIVNILLLAGSFAFLAAVGTALFFLIHRLFAARRNG